MAIAKKQRDRKAMDAEIKNTLSGGIGEFADLLVGVGVVPGAVHHLYDDGGHLGTGHVALGVELAVGASEQAQTGGDSNSFLVDDLVSVSEEASAGTDDHHAQQHNGSQSQTQSALQVSHGIFLLLILTIGIGRPFPLSLRVLYRNFL